MIKEFLGLIFPNKCMLCRKILEAMDGEYVCRLCYDKLSTERQQLLREDPILQADCYDQLEDEWVVLEDRPRQIVALFPYISEYRKSILRWKYRGVRKYAKGFAQLLVAEQKAFEKVSVDVIIPVPLAPSRMRRRGFNQALDLATEISKLENIPMWDCLKRIKDTKPQAACSKEERYSNIQGSITVIQEKCNRDVNYVVLIDDIYTTGSTVKECIKVLKKQYAFRNATIAVVVVGKGDF